MQYDTIRNAVNNVRIEAETHSGYFPASSVHQHKLTTVFQPLHTFYIQSCIYIYSTYNKNNFNNAYYKETLDKIIDIEKLPLTK